MSQNEGVSSDKESISWILFLKMLIETKKLKRLTKKPISWESVHQKFERKKVVQQSDENLTYVSHWKKEPGFKSNNMIIHMISDLEDTRKENKRLADRVVNACLDKLFGAH